MNTISNIDENSRPKINFDFDDVCYFALEIWSFYRMEF